MHYVTVNMERCEGCRRCVNVCPNDVFRISGDRCEPHRAAECVDCESCIGVCGSECIRIWGA